MADAAIRVEQLSRRFGAFVAVDALSFSVAMNPRQALDGLAELHMRLAGCAELWAGGSNAALKRRRPPYVRVFELAELAGAIGEWRARNAVLSAG